MSEFEEKVMDLLLKINQKLDLLLSTNNSTNKAIINESIPSEQQYVKPSAVVERQQEAEKALEKPFIEGRRVCPDCGGTEFRTEEDKSQVLFQQGGMKIFAKRYICKRCGAET